MLCPAIYGSDRLRPSVCCRFGTLRNRNSRIFDAKRHAQVEFCIAASAIHDPQLDQSVMTVIGQDPFFLFSSQDGQAASIATSRRPQANGRGRVGPSSLVSLSGGRSTSPGIEPVPNPLYPSLAASRSRRGLLEQPRPVRYRSHRTASATGISSTLAGATPDQYAARPTHP